MPDPYLDSGESFIVTTHRISVGFASYYMMLTTRYRVLVDSSSARFEPEKIALSGVLSVSAGRVPTGEPVSVLAFIGEPETGEARQPMNLLFAQHPGENRKAERDAWVRSLMEQVVAARRPQEPAAGSTVVDGAGYVHPSAAPVHGIETVQPHSSLIATDPAAVELVVRPEEPDVPEPSGAAGGGAGGAPLPVAAPAAGEPEAEPPGAAGYGAGERTAESGTALPTAPVTGDLPGEEEKQPVPEGTAGGESPAAASGDAEERPEPDPFAGAIRALQESAARGSTGTAREHGQTPGAAVREETSGGEKGPGMFGRLIASARALFRPAGKTETAPAPAREPEGKEQEEPAPVIPAAAVPAGLPPEQEPVAKPALSVAPGVPGMEPAAPEDVPAGPAPGPAVAEEDRGESGPVPKPPEEIPAGPAPVPVLPEIVPVEPAAVQAVPEKMPEESPGPTGSTGEDRETGGPDVSPAGPWQDSSLPAAAALVIALALAAIVFFALPLMGTAQQQGTGPLATAAATPTITPAITTVQTSPAVAVTTTAPAALPAAGTADEVWVRVNYTGTYAGRVGNPGFLHDIGGSGERSYRISDSNDLIQASVEKLDYLGAPLVVSVLRNGNTIYSRTVTAPGGSIDFIIDPLTGGFPGGIPTPTSATGLVPGVTYQY